MAANPIEMQKHLSGVDYPADKATLVEHARKHGAPEDVVQRLESLPDRTYDGPNAVSKDYSNT